MSYDAHKNQISFEMNANHKTNSKNHIPPIVYRTVQKPIGESAKALKL
jgi:hypothetical protein